MKLFGQPPPPAPSSGKTGRLRLEARSRLVAGGFRVSGRIRGRAGRIEVFRAPAPRRFLLNNWQSWGPIQALDSGRDGSTASPSGWRTTAAGSSRPSPTSSPTPSSAITSSPGRTRWSDFSPRGSPTLISSSKGTSSSAIWSISTPDLADRSGWSPWSSCAAPRSRSFSRPTPDLTAADAEVRVPAPNPVGWSSWYQYFTDLTGADLEKNLRLAGRGFPFEVFQIDDGYEADIGDWLTVKPGFPDPAGPGPAHPGARLHGRHLDGAVQRRGDFGAFRPPSGLVRLRGRAAQALLSQLEEDDLRPRHDPSRGPGLAGRDVRGLQADGLLLFQDRFPLCRGHGRASGTPRSRRSRPTAWGWTSSAKPRRAASSWPAARRCCPRWASAGACASARTPLRSGIRACRACTGPTPTSP